MGGPDTGRYWIRPVKGDRPYIGVNDDGKVEVPVITDGPINIVSLLVFV